MNDGRQASEMLKQQLRTVDDGWCVLMMMRASTHSILSSLVDRIYDGSTHVPNSNRFQSTNSSSSRLCCLSLLSPLSNGMMPGQKTTSLLSKRILRNQKHFRKIVCRALNANVLIFTSTVVFAMFGHSALFYSNSIDRLLRNSAYYSKDCSYGPSYGMLQ